MQYFSKFTTPSKAVLIATISLAIVLLLFTVVAIICMYYGSPKTTGLNFKTSSLFQPIFYSQDKLPAQ